VDGILGVLAFEMLEVRRRLGNEPNGLGQRGLVGDTGTDLVDDGEKVKGAVRQSIAGGEPSHRGLRGSSSRVRCYRLPSDGKHRSRTKAPTWGVHDSPESRGIIRAFSDPKVCEDVANLGAGEERCASNDLVRHGVEFDKDRLNLA